MEPVWRPVRGPFVVAEHVDQDPPAICGVAERGPVGGGLDARVERGIREPVRVTPGGDQVPPGAGEQAPVVRRAADDGYGHAGRDVVRGRDLLGRLVGVEAKPVRELAGVPWHCESSAHRSVSISVSRMRYGARPSPARIRASWARSAAALESWCSGAVDEPGQFAGLSRGVMHVVPASAVIPSGFHAQRPEDALRLGVRGRVGGHEESDPAVVVGPVHDVVDRGLAGDVRRPVGAPRVPRVGDACVAAPPGAGIAVDGPFDAVF